VFKEQYILPQHDGQPLHPIQSRKGALRSLILWGN
jgi:hypothetical protein